MLRRRWLELLWGVFAVANVAVIVVLSEWETIPFHLIWVSLTLLFGYRVWRPRSTAVLLVLVVVVTGAALTWSVVRMADGFDEVAEVPLMAAMFLAMVWHARKRQAAVEEAGRRADLEHRLLERHRDFIRDASHELRTPVTVARGHAELLRAACTDPQAAVDAEVVLDELDRLARLSERLLILAAAEHPGFLSRERVEVGPLVEGMVRRWSATADRIWVSSAGPGGSVIADAERLAYALDALVENAVRATDAGDGIAVSARARGTSLELEVADSGTGISAEVLPRLFERFTRPDPGRSRGAGGTGLGMAIVRAVAEAHGGSVEAESEPGRGARFRILIPGLIPAADRVSTPPETAPLPAG